METLTEGNLSLLAVFAAILPLFSFLGILLIPGKEGRGGFFPILNISLSFIISAIVFSQVWNNTVVHQQVSWFIIGETVFKVGVLLNNLSVLMLVLVSLIALLVHIYSTKYMQGDAYLHRYWAYLGLFCFSMLSLVISDNLLVLYMFWELVGFSSFLLIGFWFTKESAAKASKKAFIMNRLGDLGFLIGIMIVFSQFRTLDINMLFGEGGPISLSTGKDSWQVFKGSSMPATWLTIAGLAFFFGATAKSAQFPLHTWLPDAMEGPTSVSSLIHAATMVAAGVFLIARIYPVFDYTVLTVIASIGAFTAFMAATIALTQNDIKRILAYSTISQLGFMMIAMGVGAYGAGIFHLVTHAFFKCLLFLAAGAVIHEMLHLKERNNLDFDHQSIQNMGGLRKKMPVTFWTMLAAALALAGLPLTSGFLSKDAILVQAFEWAYTPGLGSWVKVIPYLAVLTSWVTTFYIFRLIFKVFFGEFRLEQRHASELHESPKPMKYVLLILSLFCLFLVFSLNPLDYNGSWILRSFDISLAFKQVGAKSPYIAYLPNPERYHLIIPLIVNVVALGLIYISFLWYAKRKNAPDFSKSFLFRFSNKQWYVDSLYQSVFVSGTTKLSKGIFDFDRLIIDGMVNWLGKAGVILSVTAHWVDKYIVDGFVNAFASSAKTIGNFTRHFQTGRLQHYLVTMILVVLTFFIIKYFSHTI